MEPLNVLLLWTSISDARDPEKPPQPHYDVFHRYGCHGSLYRTLLISRPVWRDMLATLNSLFPEVYPYMIDNNMDFEFEVRFEYMTEHHNAKPPQWCYVLYAIFPNPGEGLAFYMWYASQDY